MSVVQNNLKKEMPNIELLDVCRILRNGEYKTANTDDLMEFSGYVSTGDMDLSDEIVEPMSAKKYLPQYRQKGRLWLNHDPNLVLGRVYEIDVDSKGIRTDKARLAQTKFNQDMVWPLMKEGAYSEFSIQFKSLKKERVNGVIHHKEIFIIENSVVSFACNPEAVINMKNLVPSREWYDASLEELKGLYDRGGLRMPSDVRTNFFVSGLKKVSEEMMDEQTQLNNTNSEPLAVDFADIDVIHTKNIRNEDEQGKVIYAIKADSVEAEGLPLPKPEQKDFTEVCNLIYLAKSNSRGSYMFRIGVPTEKGFKYDWEAGVALTTASILGGKGQAHFTPAAKAAAISDLGEVYKTLNKQMPTWNGVPVGNLTENTLFELKYKDVTFLEGEDGILEKAVFETAAQKVSNHLKHLANTKDEAFGPAFATVLKYVFGGFSIDFDVYVDEQADFDFIAALLAVYAAYKRTLAQEDAAEDDNLGLPAIDEVVYMLMDGFHSQLGQALEASKSELAETAQIDSGVKEFADALKAYLDTPKEETA